MIPEDGYPGDPAGPIVTAENWPELVEQGWRHSFNFGVTAVTARGWHGRSLWQRIESVELDERGADLLSGLVRAHGRENVAVGVACVNKVVEAAPGLSGVYFRETRD